MSVKTPGSLGILQFVPEGEYGQTPDPAEMMALGFMNTATADQTAESEDIGQDGSRLMASTIEGMRTATLSTELTLYKEQENYSWAYLFILAMDDDFSGKTVTPASFLVKVAKDEYFMLKGGMVDKFVFGADKVGGKITAKTEIKGMVLDGPKTKVSDFGQITEAPAFEKDPIIYNAYPKVIDGTTEKVIPSHKFAYTFTNNLVPQPGIVNGLPYGAGNGIVPGVLGIELEYEVTSTDNFWDAKKLTEWKHLAITHIIDGMTFKFKDCELEMGGLPTRSQQVYNEMLKFKCHGGIEVS